jgi:hypothetical protein
MAHPPHDILLWASKKIKKSKDTGPNFKLKKKEERWRQNLGFG